MVTANTKYTREVLEPLLRQVTSFNQLAKLIGIKATGSNTTNLKRRCVEYNLDLSRMTGQGHNKGKQARNKLHYSHFLVERNPLDRRLEAPILRRAMIESGIKYECTGDNCILVDVWNGKLLRLHIDHKDGNYWNNKRVNLRFLCPNCHSQTDTWGNH